MFDNIVITELDMTQINLVKKLESEQNLQITFSVEFGLVMYLGEHIKGFNVDDFFKTPAKYQNTIHTTHDGIVISINDVKQLNKALEQEIETFEVTLNSIDELIRSIEKYKPIAIRNYKTLDIKNLEMEVNK